VDAPSPLVLAVPEQAGGPHWDAWIAESCYGFTLSSDVVAAFDRFDWLYLSATTLPRTINHTEATQLLDLADTHNVRVAFDLNGRAEQWADATEYQDRIAAVLPRCDVVFTSQEDLSLAGISSICHDLIPLLSEDDAVYLFVTRGANPATGSLIADGQVQRRASADPPAVAVQDQAGAGDGFAAGVLSALFSGESTLATLLAAGNAAGAAAVTSLGPLRPENIDDCERLVAQTDVEVPWSTE